MRDIKNILTAAKLLMLGEPLAQLTLEELKKLTNGLNKGIGQVYGNIQPTLVNRCASYRQKQ